MPSTPWSLSSSYLWPLVREGRKGEAGKETPTETRAKGKVTATKLRCWVQLATCWLYSHSRLGASQRANTTCPAPACTHMLSSVNIFRCRVYEKTCAMQHRTTTRQLKQQSWALKVDVGRCSPFQCFHSMNPGGFFPHPLVSFFWLLFRSKHSILLFYHSPPPPKKKEEDMHSLGSYTYNTNGQTGKYGWKNSSLASPRRTRPKCVQRF